MAKAYAGADSLSKAVTKAYIGIDNVARKLTKIYQGVDGIAKLVYSGAKEYLYGGTSTFTHSVGDLTDEFISSGNTYTLDTDEFKVQVEKYDDVPLYVYLDGVLAGTVESSGEHTVTVSGGASSLLGKGSITVTIVSESTYGLGEQAFYQIWSLSSSKSTSNQTLKGAISSATLSDNIVKLYNYTFENATFTELDLPQSVTTIGQCAFDSCRYLTSIDLRNVTEIGGSAFYACVNLVPSFAEGLKTIGNAAFYRCHTIVDLVIPDSVESIGDSAFYDCNNLTTVTKSAGSASLGENAFYDCTNLVSAHIEGITTIGKDAFENTGLTEVFFSENLTTIGVCAFYALKKLPSVTIPRSVTSIGAGAFSICRGLTSITFKHTGSDQLEIYTSTDTSSVSTYPAFYMGGNDTTYNITVYHNGNAAVLNYDWAFCEISATLVQE